MKAFNINSYVYVKLKPKGMKIFYHQNDELIDKGLKVERRMPEIDENGYTKMQMHRFMELFGNNLFMGFNNPIAMDILFDDKDLSEVV